MTLKEFMTELENHPTDWNESAYALRCNEDGMCFCPITYIAYKKLGMKWATHNWNDAGRHLGLEFTDRNLIMCAADSIGLLTNYNGELSRTRTMLKNVTKHTVTFKQHA